MELRRKRAGWAREMGSFVAAVPGGAVVDGEAAVGVRWCAECGARLSRANPEEACWPCQDRLGRVGGEPPSEDPPPLVDEPAVVEVVEAPRRCAWCGREITLRSPQARYCQAGCVDRAYRARKRRAAVARDGEG